MGKKSRRPNRNKLKDTPAAASPAVPSPQEETPYGAALDPNQATFYQLIASQDWAGALELESEMSAIVNRSENENPLEAGLINLMLGDAHKEIGLEGGMQQATLYYKKGIELTKKAGNNEILTKSVLNLAQCYVQMNRVEEAMDLHKSLCVEIGKKSMDPDAILEFAVFLHKNNEDSRALEILEEHLEAIDRSWGKLEQCKAYDIVSPLYYKKNDFAKSNVYCERHLSIAKETNNAESEADALGGLGINYLRMGEYDNAMAYFGQALVIDTERGDDSIGMTYFYMGTVLVAQGGREKEAILMFQKCVGLLEEGNQSESLTLLILVFLQLGQVYTSIGAWYDAIAYLEKGLSMTDSIEDENLGHELKALGKHYLGNIYLEKYESLPEPNDELIRKALFWTQGAFNILSSKGGVKLDLFLDLVLEHYFLGDTEEAHLMLKEYLDETLQLGPSHCQSCSQICAKDAIMEKCSVCKVARYCSQAHSVQAWKKGRLCHKVMCPLLKRWRKITEGKGTTSTEVCDKLFNDFFERVIASKPKW